MSKLSKGRRNCYRKKRDNPLKNESGPLIFKDDNKWVYYNAQSVKTDITDKIPLLCNSSSSPPKCGSSGETDKDICSTHLGDNWEEAQDKNGNSRCYCKIPYENRLEIDDGGKKEMCL